MSLAANAPRAFVIRHIDTDAIVSRRFLTLMAATLKSWKMGGNDDGLDHDVVGLDEDGKPWFLELNDGPQDRSNPTGYVLARRVPAAKPARKAARPALSIVR